MKSKSTLCLIAVFQEELLTDLEAQFEEDEFQGKSSRQFNL